MTEIAGFHSLKTLGRIRSDAGKKRGSKLFKSSREGRLKPIPPCGLDKNGFVFKEEMLELAPFTMTFAAVPESPLESRQCFYCMIYKRIIPMKSRGLYELKKSLPERAIFKGRSAVSCPVSPQESTSYVSKLETAKDFFMHLDVPDLEHKRPFYYDVAERTPFNITTEREGISMQIELLTIFLRGRAQVWTLEEYWTQVGLLRGHSASTADFIWSESYISVS